MSDHPRCGLCAHHDKAQPHCWVIRYDKDKDRHFGKCRHCPATSELCPDCIGAGTLDAPGEAAEACPTCEGWGIISLPVEAS